MMKTIENKDIHCNECDRFLFSTSAPNWGAIGCEAQSEGFIYKIPILFTDKYDRLFFCSKDCQKAFYDKNIPKNEKVSEILSGMKAKIPDMAKDVSTKMAALSDTLNNSTPFVLLKERSTFQLLNWGAFCNKGDKKAVTLDQLYSNFEKDYNLQKGESQKGEFDKWIEKFKSGNFFQTERQFDIYIDQASRTVFFTRVK